MSAVVTKPLPPGPQPASLPPPSKPPFFLLFPFLLIFGLITACDSAPPVVKIGLVGPFEGQHRAIGYDAIYSARLAVREINNQGGIGGYRLSLVALDDGGDPELAADVAASLVVDEAVVAVVGHWLTETTAVSAPVYQAAALPFIPAGQVPFTTADPAALPAGFLADYAALTPFDEVAGPYAAPAYDAFQLLAAAIETIVQDGRPVNRQTMTAVLEHLRYQGLTGEVFQQTR